jgi:PAS domain S-box-containing protein
MNILYVEDDPRDADLTRRELRKTAPHFNLDLVDTQREALDRLSGPEASRYDLVLTDLRLPDGDGLAILTHVRGRALPLAVVLITGVGDEETAVAVLKAGANDYVVKRGDYLARLPLTLEDALQRFRAYAARSARPLRVLYAEHNAADIDLLRRHLARYAPYIQLDAVSTAVEVSQRLPDHGPSGDYDIIMLDYNLPGLNALEMLKELYQVRSLDMPVVLVTGRGDEEVALQALKLGAADYVPKNPGYLYQLPSVLENAFHRAQLAREQAALRESEARFRRLAENAQDIIYRYCFTPTRGFEYVSPAVTTTGYTPEDLYADPDLGFKLVHPDDRPLLEAAARGDRPPGTPLTLRWIHKDGTIVWTEQRDVPIYDEAGNLVAIEGIVRDITERKWAEEALRESENKYRTLVENIPQKIFTKDRDSVYASCNENFARDLGIRPNQIAGKTDYDFFPRELADKYRADDKRIMEAEQTEEIEEKYLQAGQEVWVQTVKTPVRQEDGRVVGILGVFWDITERKRAEEALRLRVEQLDALSRASQAVTASLELDQVLAEIVSLASQVSASDYSSVALVDESGRMDQSTENVLGMPAIKYRLRVEGLTSWIVRSHRAVIIDEIGKDGAMTPDLGEGAPRFANPHIVKAGVKSVAGLPLMVKDRLLGVLFLHSLRPAAFRSQLPLLTAFANQATIAIENARLHEALKQELAERKRLEEQLIQSQKMEAIGRLAGGVAHDFNNLLTAIIGYSELLLGELNPYDPRRGDVEEINKAADQAAALTRQLLAFSRKQVLQPQVLDLNATVSNIEKMLRRLIGEDIDLVTILDPALGRVKADPGQIEQVLMNLAVNARDAMPQGGKLTIETTNVVLDKDYTQQHVEVQVGPYVMLAVSDTGVGMDQETQSHLFEPFFTTKGMGKGTGLGLATVYGIVKQSDGHIWVYSELGQGTTFKVYLPRVEEAAEVVQRVQVPTESLQGREIVLLVEDEDIVRDLARLVLLQRGYTVLEARDGEEAIQICEQHEGPVHLIVTDVVMPGGMSGRQLAERLATLRPGMKVLYMSGYTDNAIAHHGVLEPGMAFLQKPFAPEALARKVREALDAS